jgi:DNA-binding GntR family transcriptional regulator
LKELFFSYFGYHGKMTEDSDVVSQPRPAVDGRSLLADQAFDRLREGLLPGGELVALDQLVEEDLAERLQMSRTPVREALQRLSLVGLVTDHSSGGYVLRRFNTREIIDHYQVRLILEPLAASWAASRDAQDRAAMLQLPGLSPEHSSPEADRVFHKSVAHTANSRPLARLIDQFVDRLAREGVHAYGDSDEETLLASGHERVISAIADGDAVRAEVVMREHFELLLRLIPRSRPASANPSATPRLVLARPSLADRAHRDLKHAILTGSLSAGAVLTESSSAASLGVSRTTARQALRRLEVEEYLDRDTRGSLVVHRTSRTEFTQECEIRKAIESEAVRLAAIRISEEELVRLEALVVEDSVALRADDSERRAVVNSGIHRSIAVAARNKVLLEASDDLSERTFGFGRIAFAVGSRRDRKIFAQEHAEIVAYLRSGDGDLAAEVVRAHIDRSSQLLLDRMDDGAEA